MIAKAKYTVIRDTREKQGHGWIFNADDFCLGTETKKLDTGDYSLKGYEGQYAIDRKESVSEFANNLSDPRFYRELERFDSFTKSWLFCEFYFDDLMLWPATSGIPKHKLAFVKTTPRYLVMKMNEIQVKFNTSVFFCGCYGKDCASSLFKRIIEQNE